MFLLQGKTALVTGASRGIGKCIAHTLAQAGAKVIGTATSQAGADDITKDLTDFNGRGLVLNVADKKSIDTALCRLINEETVVHILVNNAAINRDNLVIRMKEDEWDKVLLTNLKGVFLVCQKLLRPMLRAKNGRIINISSLAGTTGNAGQSNYASSKAGLVAFSQSLAREVANRHITVNCVAPGWIITDMTNHLSESLLAEAKAMIPMARMGRVEDIAAAVLFLASDEANYITGQVLHCNGGLCMH